MRGSECGGVVFVEIVLGGECLCQVYSWLSGVRLRVVGLRALE